MDKNKIITLDTETTTFQKGNPFSKQNKLCMIGLKWYGKEPFVYDWLSGNIEDKREQVINILSDAKLVVGHHIMFDLHWLRRVKIFPFNFQVWDTQLGEFILSSQTLPMTKNSLNSALEKYDHPLKLDKVKTEYWDKGIDTDAIPLDVLTEYQKGDCISTEHVFNEQVKQFQVNLT